MFVSDFFDVSLHVDAGEADIQSRYIERFLLLQRRGVDCPEGESCPKCPYRAGRDRFANE